jgi:hypothetical protein
MTTSSKLRKFSGVLLILIAVAGLVLWETKGRELVLMTEVCTAVSDIKKGEALDASMFRSASVPRGSVVRGAVTPGDIEVVTGAVAASLIPEGAALSSAYIETPDDAARADDSYYTIGSKWIYMCSSALRRGDKAEIITADGAKSFGVFDVGFVKDADDGEVRETAGNGVGFGGASAEDRVDATSQIDHVEIVTELRTYLAIKDYAESVPGPSLILIGKEIVK